MLKQEFSFMKTVLKHFCYTILTILVAFLFQSFRPMIRNFSKNDYVGGAQNWDICQNEAGILFFANGKGILEFNGKDWEVHPLENMTCARSIMFDEKNSRLYTSGTGEIGYCDYAEGNGRYVTVLSDSNNGIGEIWDLSMFEDKLVFRDNSNVYTLIDSTLTTYEFDSKVEYCCVINDRVYAATTNEGIFRILANGNKEELKGCSPLSGKRICGIFDRKAGLLIVTFNGEVYQYAFSGKLEKLDTGIKNTITLGSIFCSALDGDLLALGTITEGIVIVDLETGTYQHINSDDGLQNNSVLSLYFDDDKNLWAGLNKGIALVMLQTPVEQVGSASNDIGSGYASIIYKDRLFLGTNQGLFYTGLPSLTSSADKIERFDGIDGQVWSLSEVDGQLICCHDLGIYVCNRDKVIYHIPLPGAWKVIPLVSHPDILLGCSYERLFKLRKSGGKWEYAGNISGFNRASKEFVEDMDGRIWFAHWLQGLFRLSIDERVDSVTRVEYFGTENGLPTNQNNMPQFIGNQIIFSTEGGYFRYDYLTDRFIWMEQLNTMFKRIPFVTGVKELPDGTRYFSSEVIQAVEYTSSDGSRILDTLSLKNFAGNRPTGFDDITYISEGRFIINTENGFSIISTDRLEKSSQSNPKSVFIEEMATSDYKKVLKVRNKKENGRKIILSPKDNSFIVSYICPDYDSGNNIRYSYLLENYDSEWSPESSTNYKEYTHIPHGNYIFRIKARNIKSSSESEDCLYITIKAPWYATTVANIVYLFLLIFLIYLIYRLILYISTRKAQVIAKKKEEEMMQKHLKAELEHKAEDLAASTMNLIRKNEILLKIDSDVEAAVGYINTDKNKTGIILTGIRQDIRENIGHDNDWQKFEHNFDIVYDDFLKVLSQRFPNLTVSDKKMCAYLKMDLSSKDIAPLLNMTVRSVEMTRYRLRKKLGLSREESLTDFLQKI